MKAVTGCLLLALGYASAQEFEAADIVGGAARLQLPCTPADACKCMKNKEGRINSQPVLFGDDLFSSALAELFPLYRVFPCRIRLLGSLSLVDGQITRLST